MKKWLGAQHFANDENLKNGVTGLIENFPCNTAGAPHHTVWESLNCGIYFRKGQKWDFFSLFNFVLYSNIKVQKWLFCKKKIKLEMP
jgi:hypothetical protein